MPTLNCPGARTVGRNLLVRAGCGVDGAQGDLGMAVGLVERGPMELFMDRASGFVTTKLPSRLAAAQEGRSLL
jgi:hypothetical protein